MPATPPAQPYLEVIDSFAIRRTQQFFLIGRLYGTAEPGMFAHIQLNPGLALTVRITAVEEVEFPTENKPYTLLETRGDDPDYLNLMLGLNLGLETVQISVEGED
ncbi:hypothetical protein [Hymenobacter jeollabukensis]|uniref:Uncharacterized protein n=1 Tax=Hymenobacter jeollabukensis TaxID=2025313 RepID=A0A5R8WVZ6_9BACT|nr:hypothetical protein [Hymenobacter jeollabukensis]TLM95596.1 hypothetical protein FDY95_07375 [Hymenobacter jeollabukensis]